MKRRLTELFLGWVFVTWLMLASPAWASVKATVDTQQVASGETVELTLEHDGQSAGQPDLAPLNQGFDVLGTRSGSSIQIINGHMSSTTQVVVTLSPKTAGRITIPSLTWGQDHTLPLTLDVEGAGGQSGSGSAQSQSAAPFFIETEVDSPKPYVQAAVGVTVKLYFSEPMHRASLTLPQNSDVLVMQVGQDTQTSAERNGRSYTVFTRHYSVFPQRSGEILIPGATLDAQVETHSRNRPDPMGGFFSNSPFGSMLSPTHPLRLHGDPISLSVQPRPADAGNVWIPARNVQLSAQWKPSSLQVHAGEPVTAELQLQAEGLTAEQLPDVASLWTLPQGLRSYPDQAKLENTTQGSVVLGKRTQSVALIADDAGQFTIPDLRIRWWDVAANTSREVILPGKTLTVLPAAGTVLPQASPKSSQTSAGITSGSPSKTSIPAGPSDNTWRWIALTTTTLWLATLLGWLWTRRANKRAPRLPTDAQPEPAPDVSGARSAFRDACKKGDALAARRNLLAWVSAERRITSLVGLNALAREITDPELAGLLRDLDRACFLGTPWKGNALEQALRTLPASNDTRTGQKAGLAPLYH